MLQGFPFGLEPRLIMTIVCPERAALARTVLQLLNIIDTFIENEALKQRSSR